MTNDRLTAAVAGAFLRAESRERRLGLIGNGDGASIYATKIDGSDLSGYVWVRPQEQGQGKTVIRAIYTGVTPYYGMPVHYRRDRATGRYYCDRIAEGTAVEFSGGNLPAVNAPIHGNSHIWPSNDTVLFDSRQMAYLRVTPTSPPSLSVEISDGWGYTAGTLDLTSSVPGTAGEHRLVVLSENAGTISATDGTAQAASTPFTRSDAEGIDPGDGEIPIGAVKLKNGQTAITLDDIVYDLRPWLIDAGTGLVLNRDTISLDVPVSIANGGTGATTASGARTNLGLGTIATQDADSVAVTGGTVDGTVIGGTTPAAGTFEPLVAIGTGATSATSSLRAENSAATATLDFRDDGLIAVTVPDGVAPAHTLTHDVNGAVRINVLNENGGTSTLSILQAQAGTSGGTRVTAQFLAFPTNYTTTAFAGSGVMQASGGNLILRLDSANQIQMMYLTTPIVTVTGAATTVMTVTGSVRVAGDIGSGSASTLTLTNATGTPSNTTTPTTWYKVYDGTTVRYIPLYT